MPFANRHKKDIEARLKFISLIDSTNGELENEKRKKEKNREFL